MTMSTACQHHDLTLDVEEISNNYLCDGVKDILKGIKPEWFEGDTEGRIKSKVFTEGISNHLYGYYVDQLETHAAVLIRIYGAGTEQYTDRVLENEVIKALNARDLGPPLYATFNNGISYGYVPGVTVDSDSVRLPHIRKLIAEQMAKIQCVTLDGRDRKPCIWDTMRKCWESGPDDRERNDKVRESLPSKEALLQEVNALRDHLENIGSPIVFCHNDLIFHNIVYNKETETLTFIDNEYAMYNHEHYEIAAHFNEYAGVDVDYSRFPDKAYQLDWLRYYLEQKAITQGRSPDDVTERNVERCYVLTNKFTLVSDLTCGLWALAQTKQSLIDFGFIEYAKKKFDRYFSRKEEFFAMTVPEN